MFKKFDSFSKWKPQNTRITVKPFELQNLHLLTEGKGALSPSIADNTENKLSKIKLKYFKAAKKGIELLKGDKNEKKKKNCHQNLKLLA